MRRCVVLDGPPDEVVAGLDPERVLGPAPAHALRRRLGQSFDAVVIDLRDGLDAEVLAQAMGFVRDGGALVLRMPSEPPPGSRRLWDRWVTCLGRSPARSGPVALAPTAAPSGGTFEQAAAVDELVAALSGSGPAVAALVADRGRGKSAALGLALARVPGRKVVTAPTRDAAAEVLRFAPDVAFVELDALLRGRWAPDVVAVDEAAQIPVARLKQLVHAFPGARMAFATTARGYEGTGRGFVLRFLTWLRARGPVVEPRLEAPIRWASNDPLEALIFDALCLDADAAELGEPGPVEVLDVDRDALLTNERLLRDFFGLLVHAHYRTTPSDLHRLLDAENLALHALLERDRVVAATVVALEGGLDAATCASLSRGERRIRGHALPDTLISHAGRVDAGALRYVRSVRIAVHPERRRLGLARRLVEHVHATYAPDAFGTVFGATPALLGFRRACGYELARVGSSRGARTGEPAAVMLRPISAAARALLADLRRDLARDLDTQLALLEVPELERTLRLGLGPPEPRRPDEIEAVVAHYARGPRPYEAAAACVEAWVAGRDLSALDEPAGRLVRARVLERRPWPEVAEHAGLASVPAAMRAMRGALAHLLSGASE